MLSIVRQGDLLLVPIEMLPSIDWNKVEKTPANSNVLAEGEATGHFHALAGQASVYDVQINDHPEITKLFEVKEDQVLTHNEHKDISVKSGKYALVHERELTLEQEARRVID